MQFLKIVLFHKYMLVIFFLVSRCLRSWRCFCYSNFLALGAWHLVYYGKCNSFLIQPHPFQFNFIFNLSHATALFLVLFRQNWPFPIFSARMQWPDTAVAPYPAPWWCVDKTARLLSFNLWGYCVKATTWSGPAFTLSAYASGFSRLNTSIIRIVPHYKLGVGGVAIGICE